MTVCNIEEAITSDKLIEITVNDNLYYLYDVTPKQLWFDIYGIGLYQKTAFEDINGNYVTLYDMKHGGYVEPLSNYDENLTGYIYYDNDAPTSLSEGIIVTETNTGSAKRINIYICFNDQKETWVKRVLLNSSYLFLMPGALSTIDMPLGVNYALAALEGIRTPLKPMIDSANESLNNLSKAYEDQEKSINLIKSDITSMGIRCSDLESIVLSNNATPARMIEIATNPYGVSLST